MHIAYVFMFFWNSKNWISNKPWFELRLKIIWTGAKEPELAIWKHKMIHYVSTDLAYKRDSITQDLIDESVQFKLTLYKMNWCWSRIAIPFHMSRNSRSLCSLVLILVLSDSLKSQSCIRSMHSGSWSNSLCGNLNI